MEPKGEGEEARRMMIEHCSFGQVVIDGQPYGDVLIVAGQIRPRNRELLKQLYGTSHTVGAEEKSELLSGKPDYLIIGTGQYGSLKVPEEVVTAAKQQQTKVIIKNTPEISSDFNSLWHKGFKINALIHTTC